MLLSPVNHVISSAFPACIYECILQTHMVSPAGLPTTATMVQVLSLVGSLLVVAAQLPLMRSAEHLAMAGLVIRLHGQIFCRDSGFTGVPKGLLVNNSLMPHLQL